MLNFKPLFHCVLLSSRGSLDPLHFLPLWVVLSAYLRLLIFLPAILIPVCVSSITSRQIDRVTMETVDKLYFLGLQNYCRWCSYEIKRCLLLGRKALINLGRILKSRDITLPTKVHLVEAMVFPVVMYGVRVGL